MAEACPNCGKPVLETDTQCWHCGYSLPKRARPKPAARQDGDRARSRMPDGAYDLRALVVYGLLTVAIVLALWLVMRELGGRHVLLRDAGSARPGWVSVTATDASYTLSFPSNWQWLDVSFRDQGALLAEVVARQPAVEQALEPLGREAGDVELLAVALGTQDLQSDVPVPYAVVGRSVGLADLTPQAALDRLAAAAAPVTGTALDTRLAGQPQARFTAHIGSGTYRCRHLFTAGEAAGYLLAACAPQSDFAARERDLNDILDSFRLLER